MFVECLRWRKVEKNYRQIASDLADFYILAEVQIYPGEGLNSSVTVPPELQLDWKLCSLVKRCNPDMSSLYCIGLLGM